PAWFDYENDLFYIEHGHQYDPLNAFRDLIYPVHPKKPNHIELPLGSLLQRYLFNQLGYVRPEAKFIRPAANFFYWALNEAFSETVFTLLQQPAASLQALRRVYHFRPSRKDAPPIDAETAKYFPLPYARLRQIEEMRNRTQQKTRTSNRQLYLNIFLAGLLRLFVWVFLFISISGLVTGQWAILIISLLFATASYFSRMQLLSILSVDAHKNNLRSVAKDVCNILNARFRGESAAVQFHIFSHNHLPDFHEISLYQNGRQFRQWFINTGSWQPILDTQQPGSDRHSAKFPFLRIVPDREGSDHELPELLEWKPNEGRPSRLLIYELRDQR
ncbi:MAG: hypothetical protein AAF633_27150, partial [Chloroflexota bacterium]